MIAKSETPGINLNADGSRGWDWGAVDGKEVRLCCAFAFNLKQVGLKGYFRTIGDDQDAHYQFWVRVPEDGCMLFSPRMVTFKHGTTALKKAKLGEPVIIYVNMKPVLTPQIGEYAQAFSTATQSTHRPTLVLPVIGHLKYNKMAQPDEGVALTIEDAAPFDEIEVFGDNGTQIPIDSKWKVHPQQSGK